MEVGRALRRLAGIAIAIGLPQARVVDPGRGA